MDAEETLRLAKRRCGEGRLAEAAAFCRDLIAAEPDRAEAENLLGIIAAQTGDIAAANEHFGRAVALAPGVAMFNANLSEALRLTGQPQLALEAAGRALEIDPDLPPALINLGAAHSELKDYENAARAYSKAAAAWPHLAQAHTNLGNALSRLGRMDEAMAAYRQAIELNPRSAEAWLGLGNALNVSDAIGDGAPALRRSIALAPDYALAHISLACILLARGDFGEGWGEHEWRLRLEPSQRVFPERPWRGESLAGKHIYVEAEQGFGDMLQFARYIPFLAARAAKVTFRVPQTLAPLMRASLPGVAILTESDAPVASQCDIALLSLPHVFKTRLETIPASVPYLRPAAEMAMRWRNRLAGLKGLKVGLVWAGNPEHNNDMRRSIGLQALAGLLAVPGVSFVSLQYGPRSADVKTLDPDGVIEDLSTELGDYSDTAGAILALDLVISVDTSVVHLAGALAKPVWVLTPRAGDWRWMFGKEDSPWYPTMRLYRQRRAETWAQVIERLIGDLHALGRGDSAPLTPFKANGERRAAQAAEIIALESERIESAAAPQERHSGRVAT